MTLLLDDLDRLLAEATGSTGAEMAEHTATALSLIVAATAPETSRPELNPVRIEVLVAGLAALYEPLIRHFGNLPSDTQVSSSLRSAVGLLRVCAGADFQEIDFDTWRDDVGVLLAEMQAATLRHRIRDRYEVAHPVEAARIRALAGNSGASSTVH